MYRFNPEHQITTTLSDLHPSIRPTSYMEVHQLLGTSGCSNDANMWDWSVLGVIDNSRGKVVVFPGDVILEIAPSVYYPFEWSEEIASTFVSSCAPDSELILKLSKACEAAHRVTNLYSDIPATQKANMLKQIDLFHIPEGWEVGDEPINLESYKLLLDWLVLTKPQKGPGLGLGSSGNVLASWLFNDDSLFLEFLKESDQVKWIIIRKSPTVEERLSGSCIMKKLSTTITSFVGDQFFN